jgi:hypothetical protein
MSHIYVMLCYAMLCSARSKHKASHAAQAAGPRIANATAPEPPAIDNQGIVSDERGETKDVAQECTRRKGKKVWKAAQGSVIGTQTWVLSVRVSDMGIPRGTSEIYAHIVYIHLQCFRGPYHFRSSLDDSKHMGEGRFQRGAEGAQAVR